MPGVISFHSFDLMTSQYISALPFTITKWTQVLNGAGTFNATLNARDRKVQALDWRTATQPKRTMLAIDVDGAIVWLGILWTRRYKSSAGTVAIGGSELWSYLGNRNQAFDYSRGALAAPGNTIWTTLPEDPQLIAAAILADAMNVSGSALNWMSTLIENTAPPAAFLSPTYPISQIQTVSSIITTLSQAGYGVGFDFGIDPSWSVGSFRVPDAQFTLSYPRRGRIAGSTGLTIDTGSTIDYDWPEDGSSSPNVIYATGSSSGSATLTGSATTVIPSIVVSDPTPIADGYPLMEATASFSAVDTQDLLTTCADGVLAVTEWPVITPVFTVPMFGSDIALGDFIMGDDTRVIVRPDERFPSGEDTYLRIVSAEFNASDVGVPTMAITCTTPIGTAPVPPPPS